jgi:hypothetical protein
MSFICETMVTPGLPLKSSSLIHVLLPVGESEFQCWALHIEKVGHKEKQRRIRDRILPEVRSLTGRDSSCRLYVQSPLQRLRQFWKLRWFQLRVADIITR